LIFNKENEASHQRALAQVYDKTEERLHPSPTVSGLGGQSIVGRPGHEKEVGPIQRKRERTKRNVNAKGGNLRQESEEKTYDE